MKKAVGAALLLSAMAGLSVWNIRTLDRFTDRMEEKLELSRSCWLAGDDAGAARLAESVLSDWFGAEDYTHVFIRHAEVNEATDAFYDLLGALSGEDSAAAGRAYDRLEAHLESIDTMEHVTLRSVL